MTADKSIPFNRMYINPKFRDRQGAEIYVAGEHRLRDGPQYLGESDAQVRAARTTQVPAVRCRAAVAAL
jgi:hypothetical protein